MSTQRTIQPVTQRFKLDQNIIDDLQNRTPEFGFNGLGELVFRRTYSRDNESWADVVQRVVEGCMSIRKEHFFRNSLRWKDSEWQEFASGMARSLFSMEWLPPGRGLWMMGTDFTYGRGSMSLNNCFRRNTEFWTTEGIKSFQDFEDGDRVIIRGNNCWKEATVKNFGPQQLWKLSVRKGSATRTIFTTENHRWLAKTKKGDPSQKFSFKIKTTSELEEKFPLKMFSKRTNMHYINLCPIGLQHGIVFGDGTYNKAINNCHVELFGNKIELAQYFSSRRLGNKISGLPKNWKELPTLDMNKEYLLGFLAGWFATDGSISQNSSMTITNKSEDVLKWARAAFFKLDIQTYNIKLDREISPYTGEESHLYKMVIERRYIPEKFFCRSDQHDRFTAQKQVFDWRVSSVEQTNFVEDVWCVVEPENEEFTLECGILTKNCGSVDTSDDIVHAAEWTMDALMNGVGVGFSTSWRGTASAPNKKDTEKFIIPDSREGWVESLVKLLCSYIDSPLYGRNKFPEFDYSEIRLAGQPIRGFGGVASGPEPLRKLHSRVEEYLDAMSSGRLKTTAKSYKEFPNDDGSSSSWKEVDVDVDKEYNHTRFVADVFNAIGACVVAGNVRRSAEISLGDVNDRTFINLKNYDENPERSEIGWMSNNSVTLAADHDFEDFDFIPEMASRIRDNGEPGIINLHNIQKYGRYGKEMHDDANLVNPCFSGDTMIAVADGRHCVSIKQLAEEGHDIPVYSIDPISGETCIKWGRRPRITGQNKKMLRVHFRYPHKDQYLDVTPEHEFFLNDGRNVVAKNLKPGDSIPQFRKEPNGKNDYTIIRSKERIISEHRMVAEFYQSDKFKDIYDESIPNIGCCKINGVVVHHNDENKNNNYPDNLEVTTFGEHSRHHGIELIGNKNPMFGRNHAEKTRILIGEKCKQRCQDPNYRKKLSNAQTPELRAESSKRMTEQKAEWDSNRADEYESDAIRTGLDYVRIGNKIYVNRECENENCMTPSYRVEWWHREQPFCSISCANTKKTSIEARRIGQAKSFANKAEMNFMLQASVYLDLVEEKGDGKVYKKDWEKSCKNQGISFRFNANSKNPWIPNGWRHFLQMVEEYNHQVAYIEELDGNHTVYDLTVDDTHTVCVVTKASADCKTLSGLATFNCSEISLCSYELCNLSEVFPNRCRNSDVFYKALEFATMYSSTVSLLPTHRPETNAIIAKNRRIGVSISGIAQWVGYGKDHSWGQMNYTRMTSFLRKGYKLVRRCNKELADAAGIPASIRVTTVKPSGSISLLAGATPGVHYPVSRYAIRRVRIAENSPLVHPLIEAGVPHEKDSYSDNTLVFEFTIDHGDVRPCEDVSPWEQFSLLAMMQRCWSDNMVSATIYFDKEKDGSDVEKMLAMFIPVLKSVSMLPHSGHGYVQAPYEPITQEQYEGRKKAFTFPVYDTVRGNVPEGSKYCSGDTCEL